MALPDRIEAVFLDVGGPIYSDDNFVTAVRTGLNEMRAERSLPPVPDTDFAAVYDRLRQQQSGGLRKTLAAEFLGDDTLRSELHTRTAPHWRHPRGTLSPDVAPFLQALKGKVVIGVLANQEAATREALERDGIAQYIDVWGLSAVVGHEKPSPELFHWALNQAGTTPHHAVHIGNRLDTDVRPAHALGLGTVLVLRGEAPPEPTPAQLAEPDLVVHDLSEATPQLLARCTQGHP